MLLGSPLSVRVHRQETHAGLHLMEGSAGAACPCLVSALCHRGQVGNLSRVQRLCLILNADLHNSSGIKSHRHNICLCAHLRGSGAGRRAVLGCRSPPCSAPPCCRSVGDARGDAGHLGRAGAEKGLSRGEGGRGWAFEPGLLRKRGLRDRGLSVGGVLPAQMPTEPAAEFLLGWFWGAVGSGLGQFVGTSGCLGLHHVLALSQLHHIQIVKLEWIRPR